MEKIGSEGLSASSLPPVMRPFIFHNVGASAWGLAIQKEARMIAVSANTKQIIVFAFGLGRARSPESTTSSYHSDDMDLHTELLSFVDTNEGIPNDWNTNSEPLPRDRSLNQILFLLGHRENIPDIAFCNTTDDPTGRYLVSTDIAGVILIWDIWKRSGVKKYTPVLAEHESINYVYRTWVFFSTIDSSYEYSIKSADMDGLFCVWTHGPSRQLQTIMSSSVVMGHAMVRHGTYLPVATMSPTHQSGIRITLECSIKGR